MPAQIAPPNLQWSSAVRSIAEVQNAWEGSVDVAAWWLNLLGEQAVNERLALSLEEAIVKAREAAMWTDTGALLWVRVVRLEHPDTPIRVTGIINDKPLFVGLGRDPADALFNYLGTDQIIPDAPTGYTTTLQVFTFGLQRMPQTGWQYPRGQCETLQITLELDSRSSH
jgi:hypothetical protein